MHEHDLGLAHDLKVMSRRRMLLLVGAASVAAACAAETTPPSVSSSRAETSGAAATSSAAAPGDVAPAPAETAGPYPGDGTNGPNVLLESGVLRSDIRPSFGPYSGAAQGVPMTLRLSLVDLVRGAPGAGMAVYLWQCDREGRYSLYSDGVTEQNYLRGVQVADASGNLGFTSVFPGCYAGRWPHLHFEVYDSLEVAVAGANARLTSQIALPKDACDAVYAADSGYSQSISNLSRISLDRDNVFGDGWTAEMATMGGTPATTMTASLTIGVAAKSQVPGRPPR